LRGYLLAIVEFDDQGLCYDRRQMRIVSWGTFFTRKDAAFRVALGSARELFGRLRQFRNDGLGRGKEPMVVIIGHSFGGLLVYSAVAQSLMEAAATAPGMIVPGFADLVLLINPAFEAIRYMPLHQQISERTFVSDQPAVFISVTAENDSATGTWFPFGMLWAAWGETANRGGERRSLLNTMGHIDSLITHELSVPGIRTRPKY
jgi:hypothetical protein